MIHKSLLIGLEAVANHETPPNNRWRKGLVNAWHQSRASSRNYWDMFIGIAASQDPALADREIRNRLNQEAGINVPPNEIGSFDAFEFSSVTYHGWSVDGILVAWRDLPQQYGEARDLLRRHLRARAAIWALQSVPRVEQEKYAGPGTYPAGLRAKPWQLRGASGKVYRAGLNYYQANPPLAKICGMAFHWGWKKSGPIANKVDTSGLFTKTERQKLQRFVRSEFTDDDVSWIAKELAWVRPCCDYSVYRYPEGRVITLLPIGAKIKHTAPLWFSSVTNWTDPDTPWPYSKGRVRQTKKPGGIWHREVRADAGALIDEDTYHVAAYRDGKRSFGQDIEVAVPTRHSLRVEFYEHWPPEFWVEGQRLKIDDSELPPNPEQPTKPEGFWAWLLSLF